MSCPREGMTEFQHRISGTSMIYLSSIAVIVQLGIGGMARNTVAQYIRKESGNQSTGINVLIHEVNKQSFGFRG